MMFRMALEGCTCGEIAGKLTKLGLPIPAADYYIKRGMEHSESELVHIEKIWYNKKYEIYK